MLSLLTRVKKKALAITVGNRGMGRRLLYKSVEKYIADSTVQYDAFIASRKDENIGRKQENIEFFFMSGRENNLGPGDAGKPAVLESPV